MASQVADRRVAGSGWRVARFVAIALLTFVALLALRETVAKPWAAGYRGLANAVLGHLGPTRARFVPLEPPTGWQDTRILITSAREPRLEAETRCGSRLDSYLPSALFLSLVIARPGRARRKLRDAAIGLALVHAAAMGMIGLALIDQLADQPELRPFAVPGVLRAPLHAVTAAVRGTLHPMLLLTLLVWMLVTFPRPPAGAPAGPPTPSRPATRRRRR